MSTELAEPLRVQLLGAVRAWRGDVELALGSARQRALFTVLAMRANQVVSREELVDAIWGESPPGAVDSSLYTYVSRLRRALEPVRSKWTGGQMLVSAGSGYSLRLEPGLLDVREFDRLREAAQQSWDRRDATAARAALDAALGLWRGEALTGIDGPFAALHRGRLAELHLDVLERRAEIMLESGDLTEAVDELFDLSTAYPLRETPRALLMQALHRSGRPNEALEVFRETREVLVDQLGIEPGAKLRKVHDEITAARERAGGQPDVAPRSPVPPYPKVFVGRESELAALRGALVGLMNGKGTAVWVEGEPGIGKSGLVATGLADAVDRGCEVLWQAGDEMGRRFPLSLVLACLGVDPLSPDPRRAGFAAGLPGHPTEPAYPWQQEDPVLVAVDRLIGLVDRVVGFVDELCADGPVVLVLEDLQWADDASLLVWHRLAKATRHLPLLLVGSCRPHPRRAELDPLRTMVSMGGGELLRLAPLDETAATELVRGLLGTAPGAELLGTTDCAGGNPRYLEEIVGALVRDDAVTVFDGIAEIAHDRSRYPSQPTVNTVVTRRLDHLDDTTRAALRWAALLGVEFDLSDLATVMGRQASELLPAVEEASNAGVIGESGQRFAFRHGLVRRALYEAIPTTVRVALHRQSAETLDTAGAHVERVAEQLLGGPVPADAWVTQWLLSHTNAVAGRSPSIAAELLAHAVEGPSLRDSARESLTTRLVRLRFWLGERHADEARAVLATTRDPERAAEMRLVLAYSDHCLGEHQRAVEVLRQVAADPDVPPRWRARHRALLAEVDPGDPAGASPAQAAETRWETASMRRRHQEALRHVDAALAEVSGDPAEADLELCLLEDKVFTLQNLDDLDAASRTLEAARHLVTLRGLPDGPHIPLAVHHYWLGRWDEALAELDAVVRDRPAITFHGVRQHGSIRLLHGVKALVAAHRDDSAALETHLKAAVDHPAAPVGIRDDFLSMALSVAAEQRGRPDEALRALLPLLADDHPRMAPNHQWLPRLARLALEQGEPDLAEAALAACRLGADQEAGPARATTAARWCQGLVERDPDALVAVAEHFGSIGRKVELAAVSEDRAVLLAAADRTEEAHSAFYDALTVYTGLGAAWDLRRAESRLKPFGIRWRVGGRGAADGRTLDQIEQRVAELVAAGWPNSDIATRLSMSRNTVQVHVTRLLRKLEVDSRLGVTRQVLDRYADRRVTTG
ncbi:BTAD domain-containing putative transcriptional regulator [Umezawaea sp. Da 62-37]|uniref:BTAD domain-containing putative transcriptional regulator n=1 Tax=Umezawaea sp. Da 62-37 TaxID=3075927 RepID=UPI0028F74B84|nr:BTAD domain-containing putative transcriptional regulator [Umezawaea sp. Da 62-37]WNV82667.1 BTAD domain-containing putative transcriptional regulator [Umezawaea sp. Da 62-37]